MAGREAAGEKPLKNILGRSAANLSKNLSAGLCLIDFGLCLIDFAKVAKVANIANIGGVVAALAIANIQFGQIPQAQPILAQHRTAKLVRYWNKNPKKISPPR